MELINGSYKALEKEFLDYFHTVKKSPLDKVLIITQSQRLNQRLKEELLSSEECLSCVFWQDILGLVSCINQSSNNYIPLKQKSALDYFKLKDFLQKNNFNYSAGYISALQAAFMDMQNALIMPQDLLKIEELDSSLTSKDLKDLIFVYQNYLTLTKQEGTKNYKDFFVCALDNIEKNSYLAQFKQIIFYGIYDLTSLQYDILKAVGQNYPAALFFPYEDIPAYKYIQDFYLTNIIGIGAKHKKVALAKSGLEELSSHLFEVSKEENKYSADIKIIDTSGTLEQIKSAAKEILLLRKQGLAFKDIAVCARSLEPYKNDIAQVFLQNDIPVNINLEESFLTQPLVNVCVNLLNIARNNFHKDSVLSFITSPYLKNTQANWGQIIKDIGVQTGFVQWINLLDIAILKGNTQASNLKEFLINLESKVVLLEKAASFKALALHTKEIFRTFLNLKNLTLPEQNLFETLENILEEISSFDKVRLAQKGEFLEEFNYLVKQKTVNSVVNLQRSVSVADIMNLRGNSFKAIIILGLNESVFPVKISEDPVFKDSWRSALQKLGYNIKVSAQRYLEEKLFFYFALSCASQKAILIYQRSDEEGKLKIPSIYLNWLFKIAEKMETFSLARRPLEQLLQWYSVSCDLLTPQEAAILVALDGKYTLAAQLLKREQEETFLQAFNLRHTGALGARDLVCSPKGPLWQHIERKGLSASSLKNVYQCPAKYLFDNVLEREDTTVLQRDQLDSRDKGTLAHSILEQFYRYLLQRNLFDKISADNALNILQDFIEKELPQTDYKKYGLYPLLWLVLRKEMEDNLKTFVAADIKKIQEEKRNPAYFEKDIACSFNSFKIHGQIDRIDISTDKKTFTVIDYKSGKISGKTERVVFEGANFQGPLYFELAQNLSDLQGVQADKMYYASLKDSSFKEISYEDYLSFKDKFWSIVDYLRGLIEEGLFVITPSKTACQYCLYGDICRKNHSASAKRAFFSAQANKLREFRKI
jgi:hypothetical protein